MHAALGLSRLIDGVTTVIGKSVIWLIFAAILISAINACTSNYNNSFKKVVMRGNAAAAGDMVIAKSLHERGMRTLTHLAAKHAAELAEFESRGGQLKEIKRI